MAVDSLQAPVAGYVSAEISPEARRVVESWFPEVIAIQDVQSIDEREVSSWCLRFPGVCAVLLGAGPPCQGVSGLNADRRGAVFGLMERRFGGSGHEGHRGAPPSSWFGGSRGVSGPREVIV